MLGTSIGMDGTEEDDSAFKNMIGIAVRGAFAPVDDTYRTDLGYHVLKDVAHELP